MWPRLCELGCGTKCSVVASVQLPVRPWTPRTRRSSRRPLYCSDGASRRLQSSPWSACRCGSTAREPRRPQHRRPRSPRSYALTCRLPRPRPRLPWSPILGLACSRQLRSNPIWRGGRSRPRRRFGQPGRSPPHLADWRRQWDSRISCGEKGSPCGRSRWCAPSSTTWNCNLTRSRLAQSCWRAWRGPMKTSVASLQPRPPARRPGV